MVLAVSSRLNLDENEDPDSIEVVVTGTATLGVEIGVGISGIEGTGGVGFEIVTKFKSKVGEDGKKKYDFEFDTTTLTLFVDVAAAVKTGTIVSTGSGAGVRVELSIDFAQFEGNKAAFDKLFAEQDLSGVIAAIGDTEVTVKVVDRRVVSAGVEFEASFLGTGFGFEAGASWTNVGAVREEDTTLREALVLIFDPSALRSMGNTIVSAIDLN